MITANEASRIRRVVRQLVRAEVEHSWMGSKEVSEHPRIKNDLRKAKTSFNSVLLRMRTYT